MSCDINTLSKIKEELLAQGYSEQEAQTFVDLFRLKSSGEPNAVNSAIDTIVTEKGVLTEGERTELRNIYRKLEVNIEKTIDSADMVTNSIDKILENLLSPEETSRLYGLLKKVQVASGDVQGTSSDFISQLKNTIAIHKARGNFKEAEVLEGHLEREEKKVERFRERRIANLSERNKLAIKLENLKALSDVLRAVSTESLTDEQLKEISDLADPKLKKKISKTLKDEKTRLGKLTKLIQKEIKNTRAKITKLDSKEFLQVSRKVKANLLQKTAKEAKALRDITFGYKQRLGLLESYWGQFEETLGKNTRVDVPFIMSLVGQSPIKRIFSNRDKITLEDGTKVDNTDPLTLAEAKDAIKTWRSLMINAINNGFYSTDIAVMTDENLNYLRALSTGQEIVDLSDPKVLDSIIVPDRTVEQAIASQQTGVTPESMRAQNGAELAIWLSNTISTLESLKNAAGFKGTINEAFLRSALHEKLFHISSSAFSQALKKSRKTRNIRSTDPEITATKKSILVRLGLNPDKMPEFNQSQFPDWENNFSQLIAYDIETEGKGKDGVIGIYSIQLAIYENGRIVRQVLTNQVMPDGTNVIVNNMENTSGKRNPLTPEQITQILQDIENRQNRGFKVVSFAGNGFDFPALKNFVTDQKLLTRVGIRSFDLRANIAFDNTAPAIISGQYRRTGPKGVALKTLGKTMLPVKAEKAFDDQITFTNGPVLFNNPVIKLDEEGNEVTEYETEELSAADIDTYWESGNSVNDWVKFNAYAVNDVDITLGIALKLSESDSTAVDVVGINDVPYQIVTFKPRSNLFLDETNTNDNEINFYEINKDLLALDKEVETEASDSVYTYELEYDVDSVIQTLEGWLLQAWALDPNNKKKLDFINQGLVEQDDVKNQANKIIIQIANENRKVLSSILKQKFKEYGYVDRLVGNNGKLDWTMFDIDEQNLRATFKKNESMFDTLRNETEYEEKVLEYLSEFVNNKDFVNKTLFDETLRTKFEIRQRQKNESDAAYYKMALDTILKKYLPSYNRISDFGNGTLDWKPALDVGTALAQLVLDKRPGITQIDNIVINGESIVNGLFLSGSAAVYEGRQKNFIVPDRGRVSFISPFSPQNEELSYDNFRLINRIKFALKHDLRDPQKLRDFMEWVETEQDMNAKDAISRFVTSVKNTVFPSTQARSPFDNLSTIEERRHIAYSYMYNIPRLLACFNHDCTYTGLNAGARFLKEDLPVYYTEDYLSAGSATARSVLAGAIDQIAFFSVFNVDNETVRQKLIESVASAYTLLRSVKNPETLMEMTNKSDYKYSGLHLTKAAHVWYQEASFKEAYQIIQQLGFDVNMENQEIVSVKGLNDPRLKAVDLMAEDLQILRNNREAYREKYRLTDKELELLEKSIGRMVENRSEAKELLKGAITPRFFSAGFKGIFEGLEGNISRWEVCR